MTTTPTAAALPVPGARLHYEVRGSGPVLLLIAGGFADAGIFDPLAGRLAGRFTVVAYDPRGNSRSPLDGAAEDQSIAVHADDAHRLLAAVTGEPAIVVGSSSGAIVALELVARHPEQVRVVVAHEPPAMELLPDPEPQRAFFEHIVDTYHRAGAGPAMHEFGAGTGMDRPASAPEEFASPELAEAEARMSGNIDFFLEHEIRQFTFHRLEVSTLQARADRILLANGEDSREQLPARPNVVLAERLGVEVALLPGGHAGYSTHPAAFARRLVEVLGTR